MAPRTSGSVGTEEERAAAAAVLASDTFTRAPNLSRVLAYVCEKYFRGEGHEVKEYNIAVEALGRPATFDPQTDAIVRVDMHHLRKRLQQYYAGPGADHTIQIQMPQGQYVPVFVRVKPEPVQETPAPVATPPPAEPLPAAPPTRRWPLIAAAAILVAVVAAAAMLLIPRSKPTPAAAAPSAAPARIWTTANQVVYSPDGAVRILAGSKLDKYVDELGHVWYGDRFFTGGEAGNRALSHISRTREPRVFESWRSGSFDYDIPLKPGRYQLNLYFAERQFGEGNPEGGGETNRSINVFINRVLSVHQLDVIADAGGANTADVKVIRDVRPEWDGALHLKFGAFTGTAFVNGIEILPVSDAGMRPLRISTHDKEYKDVTGRLWEPDRFYSGGRRNATTLGRAQDPDPELYATQRFGNFQYVLPVPQDGTYKLTLHFVENWLGPTNAGGGGAGDRVFDVFCNGESILKRFDIFKDAGGENRPVRKVFRNVAPSAQGKLVLQFVPIVNYASVAAIEVEQESP